MPNKSMTASQVADLVLDHEDWLIERILTYAKDLDYTQYTSTLAEDWRTSIAGLSVPLAERLRQSSRLPRLGPEDDFAQEPTGAFGILEAQRHRARGVSLGMFLGLMKYYRQTYQDLLKHLRLGPDDLDHYRQYFDRYFDRIEVAFVVEWAGHSDSSRISELQGTNRELTNEKNRYLTVFESLVDPAILVGPNDSILAANGAAKSTFRLTDSHLVDGAHTRSSTCQVPEALVEVVRGLGDVARSSTREYEMETACGPRWFRIRAHPMLDVSGKDQGAVLVFHDITEHRRTQAELYQRVEESLRESHRRLCEAERIAKMGNWDWNIVTNDLSWSDEIYRIFGLRPQEFGATYEAFLNTVHPEDRELVIESVNQAVKGEIDYSIRHRIVLPDGEVRTVHERGEVFRNDDGEPLRMIGTVIDVTEAATLEEQLRQSQKMEAVGRLAGGISHDFNNLLQIINAHVEFASEDMDKDSESYRDLMEAKTAAKNAAKLTRQLLAFGRRQALRLEHLDLNSVVENISGMIGRTIGEHVRLKTVPGPGLGTVRADRGQLEQVLLNLCLNARDAMPKGGELLIETCNVTLDEAYCESHPWVRPGPQVMLVVSDNGCGMDPDTLSHIFEPFFTTKETERGTGLGLSTVYGIVKQHEGLIHVYSEVDRGTTFRIYLPRIDAMPDAFVTTLGEGTSNRGTETILFAEDDAAIQRVTVRALERAGYEVVVASNGEEAIKLAEERAKGLDLALLDVVMPKLGGREVFGKLKDIAPDVPVLFCSGYTSHAAQQQFALEPDEHLIEKPYDMGELIRRIRELLDGS